MSEDEKAYKGHKKANFIALENARLVLGYLISTFKGSRLFGRLPFYQLTGRIVHLKLFFILINQLISTRIILHYFLELIEETTHTKVIVPGYANESYLKYNVR
ncbi:hypothetical protein CJP46_25240 [Paenibacillus sp. XY044]|nr:hypothetical protein CJP46_25240 [Paenibacillus sp. XY044]